MAKGLEEGNNTGHNNIGLTAESDPELLDRIREGEQAAFSTLVHRHTDKYLALAERVLKNRGDAEDAVQEAFIKLWHHVEKFDPSRAKFSTWFYRIVLNLCLDHKRKKKTVALPEGFDVEDESHDAYETMEEKETQQAVKAQLAELPEKQKSAIILCYFEGLSNKEAAEVLDVGLKALESLLMRGRKSLAKRLDPQAKTLLNLE